MDRRLPASVSSTRRGDLRVSLDGWPDPGCNLIYTQDIYLQTPTVDTPVGVLRIPGEVSMVTFPNPDSVEVHFAQVECGGQVGDIWQAAQAAGIKPGTIRTWMSRDKIEPLLRGDSGDIFHIPTIVEAAEAGRKFTPADPAANSRGTHHRRTAA